MSKINLAGWTFTFPNKSTVNQHLEHTHTALKEVELMTDDEWQAELKSRKALKKALALMASACCISLLLPTRDRQKPVKKSNRKKNKSKQIK